MEPNENQNIESKKQVVDRMIDSIFETLEKLEYYDQMQKDGIENLLDTMSVPIELWQKQFSYTKHKCIGLMITQFELCFAKAKALIDEKLYKEMESRLKFYKNIYDTNKFEHNGKKEIVVRVINQRNANWLELGKPFEIISVELSNLRKDLLSSLSKILYALDRNKPYNNIPL